MRTLNRINAFTVSVPLREEAHFFSRSIPQEDQRDHFVVIARPRPVHLAGHARRDHTPQPCLVIGIDARKFRQTPFGEMTVRCRHCIPGVLAK